MVIGPAVDMRCWNLVYRRCNMAEQEVVGLMCGYRVNSHLSCAMCRRIMRAAYVWNMTWVI